MDKTASEYFDDVIKTAQDFFEHLEYNIDFTPSRAILNIRCSYDSYQIFITELFSDGLRKYRYYVLQQDWVEAGFDNAPDPRAIRMKYGKIGEQYAGKNVPHLHLENKTKTILTKELMFLDFIEWLQANITKF
ncbi:conserved hypothetical protein [Candidatus Magnetomoraceae bacterium gMMP-15]